MSFVFQDFATAIQKNQTITARDTMALRQWTWEDGKVSEAEANALFDLNNLGKSNAPEWIDCFVEAITEYVVNSASPKGYVSEANADWLMARIDKDNRIETLGELELIVKILERATRVPDRLKAYVLAQIEKTIMTSKGPTRTGPIRPAQVDDAEVILLRRILFAQGGDGPASISPAEAEMLFRIKDATLLHNNAPGWQTLFVQAIGHHLMAHTRYVPLSRDKAIALDAFMDDTHIHLGRFFAQLGRSDVGAGIAAVLGSQADPIDHDDAVAADRKITADEAAWLNTKLDADATLDPIEKALIAFIADESAPSAV
jgi:hypothetical protein